MWEGINPIETNKKWKPQKKTDIASQMKNTAFGDAHGLQALLAY